MQFIVQMTLNFYSASRVTKPEQRDCHCNKITLKDLKHTNTSTNQKNNSYIRGFTKRSWKFSNDKDMQACLYHIKSRCRRLPFIKAVVAIALLDVSLIICITPSKLSRPTMMPWNHISMLILGLLSNSF